MLALARRLLPVLQLTRMALVFTAIADSAAELLLRAKWESLADDAAHPYYHFVSTADVLAIAVMSIGMYGFGMSLNDIIDRRRDQQLAAHRPLPSGRIGLAAAHVICVLLALMSLAGGAWYAALPGNEWKSVLLVLWTILLIIFYDSAGKYLVAPGLLTLGLIRFFHATVPAPHLPLVWHPLVLLNHVAILSTVAYRWEDKRPPLTRIHYAGVFGGLAFMDLLALALVWDRRTTRGAAGAGFADALWVRPALLLPILAGVAFALIGWQIRRRSSNVRAAGQNLMLYGLLWLIVYDACFVGGYVGWLPAVLVLLLAPVAYMLVQVMRWWSKLAALSQPPEFKRAGT